jgi:hypothetical protein
MATTDSEAAKIAARCRRVGWDVETGRGRQAWAYRITTPSGERVALHRSPSDVNWAQSVMRALDRDGALSRAEQEYQEQTERARAAKIAADRRAADTRAALEEQRRALTARAAGPRGQVVEADPVWVFTPTDVPDTRTVVVTPELAAKILETINTANRPLRASYVDFLAEVITDGDWAVTHQGAAIDSTGTLQDGQHRFRAIVKADKAVPMQLTVGVPPKNFAKIDTNTPRAAKDLAYIRGEANAPVLTSAARLVHQFDKYGPDLYSRGSKGRVSIEVVDRAIEKYGDELRWAVRRAAKVRRELKINAAAVAAGAYLIGRQLPEGDPRVTAFLDDLETGIGVTDKSDPIWLLRRLFIRLNTVGGHRPSIYETLAYIVKAWNYRAANRRVHTLVWRSGERFPSTIMLPPPLPATADHGGAG